MSHAAACVENGKNLYENRISFMFIVVIQPPVGYIPFRRLVAELFGQELLDAVVLLLRHTQDNLVTQIIVATQS